MLLKTSNVTVEAVTYALPKNVLNLADMAEVTDFNRIVATTGINSVHVADEMTTGDIVEISANKLITSMNINRNEIDGLILVTQTPDHLMPGTSFELHKRLKLSNSCVVFDINHGCSGYIYGLYLASNLINSGCKRVLLCTGDIISKFLDLSDRKVRMVFGDGASASFITQGSNNFSFSFWSSGSGNDKLVTPAAYSHLDELQNLFMDGNEIMKFALANVPKIVEELLSESGMKKDDINLFGFHQANKFIVEYISKLLKIKKELTPIFLKNVGNTGPSSIPIMLTNYLNDKNYSVEKSLLCGFGVGLSIGAVILNLSETKFIAPD